MENNDTMFILHVITLHQIIAHTCAVLH